jgi:hypothetical protein
LQFWIVSGVLLIAYTILSSWIAPARVGIRSVDWRNPNRHGRLWDLSDLLLGISINSSARGHHRELTTKVHRYDHQGLDSPNGMPNPNLADFQIKQIVAYILSLRK